jgi:hypothetical protein
MQLKLNRSNDTTRVKLAMTGYKDEVVEIVPNLDTRLKQSLQAVPPPTVLEKVVNAVKRPTTRTMTKPIGKASTKPTTTSDKPKPPETKPRSGGLDANDTVDPFSK